MHTHCPVCYQSENYVQVVSPSFLIPKRESDGIFERKKKEGRKEKMNTGKNKKKKGEKKGRKKEREGPKKKTPQIGTLLPPADSSPPAIVETPPWRVTNPTRQPVSSCHRQNSSLTPPPAIPGPGSGPWTSGAQTSHSCRGIFSDVSVAGSDSRWRPSTDN